MRDQHGSQENQNDTASEKVSVAAATNTAVEHLRPICDRKQIRIETDFEGVTAKTYAALIIPAIGDLLANAVAAMPRGGELCVTLVETPFQWEIEVADSGPNPSRFQTPAASPSDDGTEATADDELPTILEFKARQELHSVAELAQRYGGDVQTYACPLGGSAHVLTVPKFADGQSNQITKRAA